MTKTKSTLTLTIASNSLPAFPTGFRPEYAFRARLSGNNVSRPLGIIDYDSLLDLRDQSDNSGSPLKLAFDTLTTGEVWPKPDFAFSVILWWNEEFNATTFNIPDPWLYEIIETGAVAKLQGNQPENRSIAAAKWADYLAVEQDAIGSGSLGAQSYEAVPDPDGPIEAASGDVNWILDGNGNPV
jgi:hypothetical protein